MEYTRYIMDANTHVMILKPNTETQQPNTNSEQCDFFNVPVINRIKIDLESFQI